VCLNEYGLLRSVIVCEECGKNACNACTQTVELRSASAPRRICANCVPDLKQRIGIQLASNPDQRSVLAADLKMLELSRAGCATSSSSMKLSQPEIVSVRSGTAFCRVCECKFSSTNGVLKCTECQGAVCSFDSKEFLIYPKTRGKVDPALVCKGIKKMCVCVRIFWLCACVLFVCSCLTKKKKTLSDCWPGVAVALNDAARSNAALGPVIQAELKEGNLWAVSSERNIEPRMANPPSACKSCREGFDALRPCVFCDTCQQGFHADAPCSAKEISTGVVMCSSCAAVRNVKNPIPCTGQITIPGFNWKGDGLNFGAGAAGGQGGLGSRSLGGDVNGGLGLKSLEIPASLKGPDGSFKMPSLSELGLGGGASAGTGGSGSSSFLASLPSLQGDAGGNLGGGFGDLGARLGGAGNAGAAAGGSASSSGPLMTALGFLPKISAALKSSSGSPSTGASAGGSLFGVVPGLAGKAGAGASAPVGLFAGGSTGGQLSQNLAINSPELGSDGDIKIPVLEAGANVPNAQIGLPDGSINSGLGLAVPTAGLGAGARVPNANLSAPGVGLPGVGVNGSIPGVGVGAGANAKPNCELCAKPFGLFAKSGACVECGKAVCPSCSGKFQLEGYNWPEARLVCSSCLPGMIGKCSCCGLEFDTKRRKKCCGQCEKDVCSECSHVFSVNPALGWDTEKDICVGCVPAVTLERRKAALERRRRTRGQRTLWDSSRQTREQS
jgi:hypothetical protein